MALSEGLRRRKAKIGMRRAGECGRRSGTLVIGFSGNIFLGPVDQTRGEIAVKWLVILLLPLALAGCVTEQNAALPMALAPSDTAPASCLTYGDTPAYGDCQGPGAVSISQE